MSPERIAVWRAVQRLGEATVQQVTVAAGIKRSTTHHHLHALTKSGHLTRTLPYDGRGKPSHRYTATAEPVPTFTAVDAVREVLAAGPVTGFKEVVRRSGYCDHSVAIALGRIAVRQRIGQASAPTVYRLREGA
jgi:hypothetical protein